jgi:hypothetical protein
MASTRLDEAEDCYEAEDRSMPTIPPTHPVTIGAPIRGSEVWC